MATEVLMQVSDVVKQFPAVRALDGVSLEFRTGEVHGLVGENGAGKSTLMKILSGVETPTSGSVAYLGETIKWISVADALKRGVVMIHQELNLVDDLSVAENILLGREPGSTMLIDRATMAVTAQKLLDRVGAQFSPQAQVRNLSVAEQQLVEIAKALSYDAKVVIMDEPTAVLTEREVEKLFELVGELRSAGVAVIYISHILPEVLEVCDRITVLRDGQVVGTYLPADLTTTKIAKLMVGRELGEMFGTKPTLPVGDDVLVVEGASIPEELYGVNLRVRPGEILGIAGLVGSGRTELAEAICGLRPASFRAFRHADRPRAYGTPRAAIDGGLGYVSEDRKGAGLLLDMNCVQNVTIANLSAFARPWLDSRKEMARAEHWKSILDIRVGHLMVAMRTLSGGNQQKFALAKWLETDASLLIFDEPTRGIDVGSKREIYHLISHLAASGKACIVISSEMTELIGMCHRVMVLRSGQCVGELEGEAITEQNIIQLAAGVEEVSA